MADESTVSTALPSYTPEQLNELRTLSSADTFAIGISPTTSTLYTTGSSNLSFTGTIRGRITKPYERFDLQYRHILEEIMFDGVLQNNRTAIPSKWIPTAHVKVDLQKEFPVLTLRKIYPKAAIGEMLGFLRGYTNSQHFEELGCKYWHANANNPTAGSTTSPWLSSKHRMGENDLGEIYGDLWRNWQGDDGMVVDQVADLVQAIVKTPDSRRILVTGWKPESVKQVRGALPPCHLFWQVMVDTANKELHLSFLMRSVDTVLGLPSNIVEYSFLLELLARVTGYKARTVTAHLNCVHVYQDHFEAANKLLERPISFYIPEFQFKEGIGGEFDVTTGEAPTWFLKSMGKDDYEIFNYKPCDAITGLNMAV